MFKHHLLFIPLALGLSAQAWADTNAEKIRFVRGLYTKLATHYYTGGNTGIAPRYDDTAEEYADTRLAAAYAQARSYDRRLDRAEPDAWDYHCLGGATQMYGGGQDAEPTVRRNYSVTPDGRVKVSFRQFSFPEADQVTVHYTLRRHGNSFRVVDYEIKRVSQKNGLVFHIPSYRVHLNQCVRNLRREFRLG